MRNIDVDAILETANLGVRRTAVFLGLGLNAAANDAVRDYGLGRVTALQLVPANADEATLADYKTEFGRWIVACGLRELADTFAVFLDQVHDACLTFALSKKRVRREQAKKYSAAFCMKGVREKLKQLESRFSIAITGSQYLSGINQARNCLTHRRGIVGREDCDASASLTLRWKGMDLFVKTPTGEEISLNPPLPDNGVLVETGGTVALRFQERARVFREGDLLDISPRDLAEICHLFLEAPREVVAGVIRYAQSIGVPLLSRERRTEEAGHSEGEP
jgi:hypothetical protein